MIVDDTPRVAAVEPPADGNHRPKSSKQANAGSAYGASAWQPPPVRLAPSVCSRWPWSRCLPTSRTGAFLQGSPLISGDGDTLVYRNYDRVVAYDRSTGHSELINVMLDGKLADPYSYPMDVSADGRYVLFVSNARNLVPNTAGEDRAFRSYVRDRQLQITERVSVSADGTIDYQTPPHVPSSMSADGRYVAFASITRGIDNMAVYDVFRRDRLMNRTWIASVNSNGVLANSLSQSPLVSGDGHIVAFSTERLTSPRLTPMLFRTRTRTNSACHRRDWCCHRPRYHSGLSQWGQTAR